MLSRLGAAGDDEIEEESAESEVNGDDPAGVATMAPKLGSFEVMNRAFDVMQAALARHQLAAYPLTSSSRCRAARLEASTFTAPPT